MSEQKEFDKGQCPTEMIDELAVLATSYLVGILRIADKYQQDRLGTAMQSILTFDTMVRMLDIRRFDVGEPEKSD